MGLTLFNIWITQWPTPLEGRDSLRNGNLNITAPDAKVLKSFDWKTSKGKFKNSRHKQNSSLIFLEAYWETNEPVLILRSFEVMKPGWTRHHIPLSMEAQLMHSWSWNIISATLDVVEGGDTLGQNHETLSRRSVLRTRPANSPPDLHLSQTQKTLQLRTWW